MFFLFLLVFLVLIFKGYILLEEETLIILASVFWVDAAGGFIRQTLESELVHKGDIIKENYLYFLQVKKDIILLLLELHERRVTLKTAYHAPLRSYIMTQLLTDLLSAYNKHLVLSKKYIRKVDISAAGLSVVSDIFVNDLEKVLNLVDKDNIDLKL